MKVELSKLISRIAVAGFVAVAVRYGGAKPAGTNAPPDVVSSPTNSPTMMCFSPRPMMLPPPEPTTNHQQPTNQIPNWTARGAYCDWERIDFCDGFRFPIGTNFIDGVTLFAYGEVRLKRGSAVSALVEDGSSASSTSGEDAASPLSGAPSTFIYSLPARVSLEPNASSVSHGLTPSNSYLFAWHNCCVERSATNRVNASIELFRSGAVAITTTPTNGLPTTIYQLPTLPEGWIGVGQDEAWIRATFPDEADHILALGYENWLLNEFVGINEENGHYMTSVTIAALPADGSPCYLVCGPYRVNVVEPGVCRFPLNVFETYEARTYPTAIPLSFEHDDGYRGEGVSFEIVDRSPTTPRPRLLLSAPRPTCDYWWSLDALLAVSPQHIPLDQANGAELQVFWNVADYAIDSIAGAAGLIYNVITHSRVRIEEARQKGWYEVTANDYEKYKSGYFEITDPIATNDVTVVTNRVDAWIFRGDSWHEEMTNGNRMISHLTAVTQGGSTAEVAETMNLQLLPGESAYVAVFMATSETYGIPPYDDRVSWTVTSNVGTGFSGTASVLGRMDAIHAAQSIENDLYGIKYDPLFLEGAHFAAPSDGRLRLRLMATAQNVGDGLRETCVQIVVFPTDANGAIIGWPPWL